MKEVQKSALKVYEGRGLIIELNKGITCNIFNHFTGQYLKKDITKHESDMIMEILLAELCEVVRILRRGEHILNHQFSYINYNLIDDFTEPLNESRGIIVLEAADEKFFIQNTLFRHSIGSHLSEEEMLFFMDELTRLTKELVEDKDYKCKVEKYLKNHSTS